jgi:hypothetical protein
MLRMLSYARISACSRCRRLIRADLRFIFGYGIPVCHAWKFYKNVFPLSLFLSCLGEVLDYLVFLCPRSEHPRLEF